MNNLKNEILTLINNNISIHKRNANTKHIYYEIVNNTQFLLPSAKIKERIYVILSNITEAPICACGNNLRFMGSSSGYRQFCSTTCAANANDVKQKKQDTCFKNYGVTAPAKSSAVREKMQQTTLEKFGVKHSQQADIIHTKTKLTNLNKYGVESFTNSDKFRNQSKQTVLDKYGVDHIAHVPEIQERKRQTILNRYGVEYPSRMHLSQESISKAHNKKWLTTEHHNNKRSISNIAMELGYSQSQLCKLFNKHGIEVKRYFQSTGETELYEFIKSHIPTEPISQSDRSILGGNKELDIHIKSLKLAFEYDGVYWHSELAGKDKHYHINKTKACQAKDIRLVHIWDIEWILKRAIVQSRIDTFLGLSNTLYARKCKVVSPSKEMVKTFMNSNHIQGHAGYSLAYGLEYDGVLVSVLTMGKSRFTNKYEYELIRYANILNTSVVGGASRLFKHFININNPTSIITYSDKRWNTGKVYFNLGFVYSHSTSPNYFYFTTTTRIPKLHSRQQFQKHKLKNKLEYFDSQLTEWQNMKNNGYNRIWDCGNDVFVWTSR